MTPLLLLDVDGVLNALANEGEHEHVWPQWRLGHAQADGVSWPIVWAPAVVQRLRDWHDSGVIEIHWLTTWGHDANAELRRLLGLPELPVAGTYDDVEPGAAVAGDAVAHAAAAPSAPDPLSGRWWKYDVVSRLLTTHTDRLVVWVDDELHSPAGAYRRWCDQQPRVVAVGPDPRTGLTVEDLARIEQAVAATPERRRT